MKQLPFEMDGADSCGAKQAMASQGHATGPWQVLVPEQGRLPAFPTPRPIIHLCFWWEERSPALWDRPATPFPAVSLCHQQMDQRDSGVSPTCRGQVHEPISCPRLNTLPRPALHRPWTEPLLFWQLLVPWQPQAVPVPVPRRLFRKQPCTYVVYVPESCVFCRFFPVGLSRIGTSLSNMLSFILPLSQAKLGLTPASQSQVSWHRVSARCLWLLSHQGMDDKCKESSLALSTEGLLASVLHLVALWHGPSKLDLIAPCSPVPPSWAAVSSASCPSPGQLGLLPLPAPDTQDAGAPVLRSWARPWPVSQGFPCSPLLAVP